MAYSVKEIFYTLQGEGLNAGRPAVFCRFAGCNLWNGRDEDRATAVCRFCDTDFNGTDGTEGGRFDNAATLARHIARQWPAQTAETRLAVLTGGEPALQLDADLVGALHAMGFEVAVETNGTVDLAAGVDWVCVSPKAGTAVRVTRGDELKLVYPQPGLMPADVGDWQFRHFLLQPMDGPERAENTRLAIEHCMRDPRWRLSIQTHKIVGIR